MQRIEFDVVVIGSGIAGLSAALSSAEQGLRILIVSRYEASKPHSINGAGMNGIVSDSLDWKIHARDTIVAGDYLSNQLAVETMCTDAYQTIERFITLGAPFRRNLVGSFGREIYHTPDITGRTAIASLWKGLKARSDVHVMEGWRITDVVVENHAVAGIKMFNGSLQATVPCRAVVLATGGTSTLYSRATTSASHYTADGIMAAFRCGALLADLEMIQFHPTALPDGSVISESARAAGAILRNSIQEPFMHRYAPQKRELAPRDVVSRAIFTEIESGRGSTSFVYLDFTKINSGYWDTDHIKEIRAMAMERCRIDIQVGPIPVAPAMHYLIGGVKTDINGSTNIPGLYAAGETASTGVHGANRLGGNSLLEASVFGWRAGLHAAKFARTPSSHSTAPTNVENCGTHTGSNRQIGDLLAQAQAIFGLAMGIKRSEVVLAEAVNTLSSLQQEVIRYQDEQWSDQYWDVANTVGLGLLSAHSALLRQESRGAHYRIDYPARDDTRWSKHILLKRSHDDSLETSFEPVTYQGWFELEQREMG